MGAGRWALLGAGSALVAAVLAAATPLALQGPERDWGAEARATAQRFLLDRAPDAEGAEFADVEVRRTGDGDERWVCGSLALRDEEGALGPFRDFWVTVGRVPDTWADIREVRANDFGRDDFLDRNSALFRACFGQAGTE